MIVLTPAMAAGILLAPTAAFAATQASGHAAPARHMTGGGDPTTRVTFAVTSGALTMTAPGAADLGSGAPGTTISGVVSPITVTDDRALLAASWIVTAAETDFTTGGGSTNETIPGANADYSPGIITTTGTITATPTSTDLTNSPQTVVTGTNGVGDNSATWTAGVSVDVPAGAVTGTYTGTLTQSVT